MTNEDESKIGDMPDPVSACACDCECLTREDLQGVEDAIRDLRMRTNDPFQIATPHKILAVLLFLGGMFFGWLLTPSRDVSQIYHYDYHISRGDAPRLAIDPGAMNPIGPILIPNTHKEGASHD